MRFLLLALIDTDFLKKLMLTPWYVAFNFAGGEIAYTSWHLDIANLLVVLSIA
jgi:hypothetical protein